MYLSDFILTSRFPFFRLYPSSPPSPSFQPWSQPSPELTLVHAFGIKNLKAIAHSGKKWYLCVEMSGKGLISRMSDECLMKQETVFSFYVVYQAVMRKFTLAREARVLLLPVKSSPNSFLKYSIVEMPLLSPLRDSDLWFIMHVSIKVWKIADISAPL